ncbi:MAG: type II toxin-antitoxin system HicA family toxin [Hyphomicrobiales bacterium]
MAKVETDRAKILARLRREGWIAEPGSRHDKFGHTKFRGLKIMVPRHKTLTPGVARSIAKAAGWIA